MSRILAHSLRERDGDERWDQRIAYEPSSSSNAAAPGTYRVPHARGDVGIPRVLRRPGNHAAPFGGMARSSHVHSLDDPLAGERALQEAIEQSKKAHLMSELPRESFHPERHKGLVECELCLMEYETGDELMRLPCLHLFHSNCVSPWLHKSYTCPVCQTDVCQAVGL